MLTMKTINHLWILACSSRYIVFSKSVIRTDDLIPTRLDLEFASWSYRNHRERLPALVPHQFRKYSRCHPVQLVSLDRTKKFRSILSTVTKQDTHSPVSKLSRDMSKVRNRHRTVIVHAWPFDRAAKRVVGRRGFLVWGHLLARILDHSSDGDNYELEIKLTNPSGIYIPAI